MWFLNDRLMQTEFVPTDLDAFMKAKARQLPGLVQDGESRLPPFTRVSRHKFRLGLLWEDIRLAQQYEEWVSP